MTGRARQLAHRQAARAAVLRDRWAVQSEHEQNVQALRASAAIGGRKVTAFFLTNERRATRVLRNFLRAL